MADIKYVVVSPVKDEEKSIEITIRAVLNQTMRPIRWTIVDDGSSDQTASIVERYAAVHDWIQLLRLPPHGGRNLGWAEIRAFASGYEIVKSVEHDFLVKLDGDLDFAPDYFEQIFMRFCEEDRLGIASGDCLERTGDEWLRSSGPSYHAVGASKVIRRKCFEDIGGFVLHRGWDTVDEIRAQVKGWKTGHFEHVKFYHLRKEGAACGALSTGILHGEVYYWTGGGGLFLLLKVLHRSVMVRPYLLGGLALLWGYVRLWVARKKRIVSDEEAKFYTKMLNERIREQLRRALKWHGKRPFMAEDC